MDGNTRKCAIIHISSLIISVRVCVSVVLSVPRMCVWISGGKKAPPKRLGKVFTGAHVPLESY